MKSAEEVVAYVMAEKRREGWMHPWPLEAYACTRCGGYHVGHTSMTRLKERVGEPEFTRIINEKMARTSWKPRSRCDVIMCAEKGPHRCERIGNWYADLDHFVCWEHMQVERPYRVFTVPEAVALHRQRRKQKEAKRDGRRDRYATNEC